MKHVPLIKSVMTPFPYSIDIDATIGEARAMMAAHKIHHLPVKQNGKLVSVITDRDAKLKQAPGAPSSTSGPRVRDVCVADAYIVNMTERLDSVLFYMAQTHTGSALVVKNGKLVGIFTTSDACRCYGEYLRSLFPTTDGHDAA
jgi:acetoin utilization protein AcuB